MHPSAVYCLPYSLANNIALAFTNAASPIPWVLLRAAPGSPSKICLSFSHRPHRIRAKIWHFHGQVHTEFHHKFPSYLYSAPGLTIIKNGVWVLCHLRNDSHLISLQAAAHIHLRWPLDSIETPSYNAMGWVLVEGYDLTHMRVSRKADLKC